MLEIEVRIHGDRKNYCTSTFANGGGSEMENYKTALKNVATGRTKIIAFIDDYTGSFVAIPPSMCSIECREVPNKDN